jgi:tetratricopeptide (TPR) repeat protein
VNQNRQDDAFKIIADFVAENPSNTKMKLMYVSLVGKQDASQALGIIDTYISSAPNEYKLYFAKAELLLNSGELEKGKATLKEIIKLDSIGNDGLKAESALAKVSYSNGEVSNAKTILENLLTRAPEYEDSLLLRAEIQIHEQLIDAAVTDLRVVLRNNPDSDKALVMLAQAYLNSGSTELADDNFRQALTVNPGNSLAALKVADRLLKSNQLDRTEEILQAALKNKPNDPALLQALTQVKILQKDWYGSRNTVKDLIANDYDPAVASFFEGRISQEQGLYEEAIEAYKLALTKRPNFQRAMQRLAECYLKVGNKAGLITYLQNFSSEYPAQRISLLTLSDVYVSDKEWEKAISIINNQLKTDKNWAMGFATLSEVYLAQKQPDLAINTLKLGLDAIPNNLLLQLKLASLYENLSFFEQAVAEYKTVLNREPKNLFAINNLATLYTDRFSSPENLAMALDLAKNLRTSSQPYFLDTYAWVNVQLEKYEEAESVLKRVISIAPDVPVFNYHMAELYYRKGDTSEAEKYARITYRLAEEQRDTSMMKSASGVLEKL